MFNKFTERARKVLLLAKEDAKRLNHDHIDTAHILLALTRDEGEAITATVFEKLGVSTHAVRQTVQQLLPKGTGSTVPYDIPFSPDAKKVFECSMKEARRLKHQHIGIEDLLMGLMREVLELNNGVVWQSLKNLGITPNHVLNVTEKLFGTSKAVDAAGGQIAIEARLSDLELEYEILKNRVDTVERQLGRQA